MMSVCMILIALLVDMPTWLSVVLIIYAVLRGIVVNLYRFAIFAANLPDETPSKPSVQVNVNPLEEVENDKTDENR